MVLVMKNRVYLSREANKLVTDRVYTIYSKWIDRVEEARPGNWVQICDWRGEPIGVGFYEAIGAVGIRIFKYSDEYIEPETIIFENILAAYKRRHKLIKKWDSYRLVNADGDQLPGLIVDIYRDIAVLQSSSIGVDEYTGLIADILTREIGVDRVYIRNDHRGRREAGLPFFKGWLIGKGSVEVLISEGKAEFWVNIERGQKTGFFLDHRMNRINIETFTDGYVLDLYSYTGGFAIHSLLGGATRAYIVEEDDYAVNEAYKNFKLNNLDNKVEVIHSKVEHALEKFINSSFQFDLVIVDPPAFILSKEGYRRGLAKYKSIYRRALKVVKSGGLIFASSCSYFISNNEFREIIVNLAKENNISITHVGKYWGISPDHMFRPIDKELNYLKCYLFMVEKT